MKKIKLLLAIAILFSIFSASAQDQLKRANTYFDRAFYSEAIPLYEEIATTNKSAAVIKNLADSYYNTYQMPQAAKWYAYLTSIYGETLNETYFFKYSESLKATGELNTSFEILTQYYQAKEDTTQLKKIKSDFNYLENIQAIGPRFSIENLALNTTNSEFGAVQIANQIVYTASKKKNAKIYRWNNQNYLDLYQQPVGELMYGDSLSKSFSTTINTKMHEGTFAITKDRNTLYFTRNNFIKGKKKTDAKKISNLKIYRATRVDSMWANITALSFNSDDFSNEHPSLSSDEKTLYFASDRSGGFGSFDIYKVHIQENDFYTDPENLGSLINTDKKEQFPFIDKNDNLYFSSNGHPGFGLLDIFIAKKDKNQFHKPDNVGFPVNSSYDDFSYFQNKDKGFFASNRPGGKGSDDIYSFTITKPLKIEACAQVIVGVVTNRTTKKPLPFSTVHLLDSDHHEIAQVITKEDATFSFAVDCEMQYRIEAKKEQYEDNFKVLRTIKERNAKIDASLSLYATAEKERVARIVLQEKEKQALEKVRVAQEKKLKEEKEAAEALVVQEKQYKEKAERDKAAHISKTINTEKAIVKEKNRTVIKTQAINFDYNMWYLRRETRERLETVVATMENNPSITIEIGSHTDRRGNNNYNKELSQKRANSVKTYLLENGIAAERIIAKGYGASQPIIACASDDACSEEEHELNRRCEFVIVKWE
ncbi:OmpA family protein [Cellulophaga sp. Z1A5H]|uniref:OmpA family protein n=1 Tax=Cellulophaga sp. Z1A5H TaxID=2687291 RepID=UPI0013FD589F|nr:OmpA family protein [Cellulophaga sp. Z1A5H]